MYAIELLRMIEKFEKKYPDISLEERGIWDNGFYLFYENTTLLNIELKFSSRKKTYIPELKNILEKNKYKKIKFINSCIYEIESLILGYDLIVYTIKKLETELVKIPLRTFEHISKEEITW